MGDISTKLERLRAAKADIKAALEEKGAAPSEVFASYGDEIRGLELAPKLDHARDVTVVARNQIIVGDTVYTVETSGGLPEDALVLGSGDYIYTAALSPDGTVLVLGGRFSGFAKVFEVRGTTIRYVRDLYADNSGTPLNQQVRAVGFSPDGNVLVLGGYFTNYAKVYTVNGTDIAFASDVPGYAAGTPLNREVYSLTISPDGRLLVLGGGFYRYANLYTLSGTDAVFINQLFANDGTIALSGEVHCAAFSPDGTLLVLGGQFMGRAKAYSITGTAAAFIGNLYADAGTTALSGTAATATFSPNGRMLVLGGGFKGYGKLYSVQGTTVTYMGDIRANAGNAAFDKDVLKVAFSPDGKTLAAAGSFAGAAKLYEATGEGLVYLCDVRTPDGSAALGAYARSVLFSPGGEMLILAGAFDGGAAHYQLLRTDPPEIAYGTAAWPAAGGVIPAGDGTGVGFARAAIAAGETGEVRLIGTLELSDVGA